MKFLLSQFERLKQSAGRKLRSIASWQIGFFLLFIALPVLIILLLFGIYLRYQIVENTKDQREMTLRQHASVINVELQNMSIITSSLIHNAVLADRSTALIKAQTIEQRYLSYSEIERLFQTYLILSRQLVSFYMIPMGEEIPYVTRNHAGVNIPRVKINAYVEMADASRGVIVIPDDLSPGFGRPSGLYIATLAVTPAQWGAETGVRTLLVSFVINSLANFIGQNTTSDFYLAGRNGIILASNDITQIGEEIENITGNYGNSRIIIKSPVATSGWTVVEAINIRALTRPLNTTLNILYLSLIVIVLLFIRYNTLFFARILKPLRHVISKMELVGNGDFSVRTESSRFIEINKMSESFNFMVEKIGVLTEAIKEEQQERTRTEIEALRYQLNPHFLCNALNAIRMMAIMTKNDSIRKMSAALMMITEDTLAREDTVYSLEHELNILDSYVYVMQVRYGNTFELIKDVDNLLLNLGVPSMILQPLVENSILHGFHGLSRPGTIVVSASLQEDTKPALIISVRDNGSGMDEETLNNIFNEDMQKRADNREGLSKSSFRIGLYNVRRRIMLSYGSFFKVDVASYPGEGTVVTLKLPVQQTDRYESRADKRKEF